MSTSFPPFKSSSLLNLLSIGFYRVVDHSTVSLTISSEAGTTNFVLHSILKAVYNGHFEGGYRAQHLQAPTTNLCQFPEGISFGHFVVHLLFHTLVVVSFRCLMECARQKGKFLLSKPNLKNLNKC
ncbi:unnamed protein product [Lactuca virosa]|uniref:Uncharacterized protein n=1 Tax=Lactuca virosa TaxID=75947 RepID=A0AAU9MCY6_9ASTR|nr:unnamed protein product [Lactuca virosa]